MDSSEICRVCVEEVNCYWFMFESCEIVPSGLTPAQIIAECANIEIERDDGLPESVCKSCFIAMMSAYEIRKKCISSDRKLRKLLLHKKGSIAQRAMKRPQQAFQTDNEIETKRQTTDDGKEAKESTDEGDLNADYHTEPEYVDASHEEVEGLEPDSYNEDYLIDVKQDQQEDYDDNDEDQSISGDDDEVGDDQYNSVGDKTIDMEVEMLENDVPNAAAIVEPAENSQTYSQSDASEGKKKFVCDICGKDFSTKGNLKAHIQLHNNYKPFRCELCGEEFSRKFNYNVHMVRHTDKRNHQCPKCDKSFVCNVNLKHHMIIHSNVKPFKCDQCAKGFFYRTDLVRHEVKHTGIYPFECEKCQQKFSRKISLTKHLPRCKGQKKESLAKKAAGSEVANK